MRKLFILLMGALVIGCGHVEPSSRAPSSMLSYPTALMYDQVPLQLTQINPKNGQKVEFNLKVDLFHTAAPGNIQPQRIILFFGSVPKIGVDDKNYFSPIMRNSGVNGTLVVITDDYDGQIGQKILTGPAGFDRFLNGLFAILKDKKWIVDFNEKIVLLAYGSGAETLDKIGLNPSNFFKANAEAVGFFNGQLEGNSAPGIVNLLAEPRIGFKTYVVSTDEFTAGAEVIKKFIISAEGESQVSVEHVSETIQPKFLSEEEILERCLPLFLRNLRVEPFITFSCKTAK